MMRKYWPLLALSVGVLVIVAVVDSVGGEQLQTTLIEMLIRMIVVVAMQLFIGNSGVLSFGHIGFMCIGAYAAAWATCEPTWKQLMLTGLAQFPADGAMAVPGRCHHWRRARRRGRAFVRRRRHPALGHCRLDRDLRVSGHRQ